ncbi:MAG: hypothetical protein IPH05_06985 [Flavobacteriales bacterium]|nr:hypothetical protein [Flavobacteriales bacterium]
MKFHANRDNSAGAALTGLPLCFQTGSTFNGNVTTTSPGLYMNGSAFRGTAKVSPRQAGTSECSSAGCTFSNCRRVRLFTG